VQTNSFTSIGLGHSDGKHTSRLALAFVVINSLVWWLLFSFDRSSLDSYGDMAEAYAWGIS
jgi:hypothetical protein